MAFQPNTITELRNKLATLKEARATHKGDLDHYTDMVAKYQAKYDAANAAVEDYASLLEYAEVTNGFNDLPTSDDEGEAATPAAPRITAEQAARSLEAALSARKHDAESEAGR